MSDSNTNITQTKNAATRWNALIQIVQKAVSPLTNILLAHILAPEVFGIVASITLVISFLDVFTEAGFQKYLVFCEAKDDADLGKIASVAFSVNFAFSLFLFTLLVIFREQVANLVGVPGKGTAVMVAALALPLTSFSSIQGALIQRQLQYKKLFAIQLIGSAIPIVITVPLALSGIGYWALLIGKVASNLYTAIALTVSSKWKPRFTVDFPRLKKMLGFCGWSMGESVTTWLATNLDILIVSSLLSSYYLGLYKTSISLVNEGLRIVSSAILPVTYSVISRLKNDEKRFNQEVYRSQQMLASIVLPMGAGLFLFRDLATNLALGSQWLEAADLLGFWSLATCIDIAFAYICDDVYRAIGKPRWSFVTHMAIIIVLIPAVYFSANIGYAVLVIVRPLTKIVGLVVREIALRKCSNISVFRFVKNSLPPILGVAVMWIAALVLQSLSKNVIWQFVSIGICAGVYFTVLYLQPSGRKILGDLIGIIRPQRKLKAEKE